MMNVGDIKIEGVDQNKRSLYQEIIDQKTKPKGSLGYLEEVALKLALMRGSESISLSRPHMLVFAADHGIAQDGVSAYPSEVTAQMVFNFVGGGAAINVLCKQNNIELQVVDAGVNFDFDENLPIRHNKIAKGSKSFLSTKAMTEDECKQAITTGAELVNSLHAAGSNTIAFGEMGIGNTSSASCLMHMITHIDLAKCTGRGAGLNDEQFKNKLKVLEKAIQFHHLSSDEPLEILQTFGGFEIAMIVGAILEAARLQMTIIIDGFIIGSAVLIAHSLHPNILDFCIFSHLSDESGHKLLLEYLGVKPLFNLGMRLGEGSAAALALPIIQAAANFFNDMASFADAGVSNRS